MSSTHSISVENQVTPIDLEYRATPEAAAAFLILTGEGPVLVECGPSRCLSALERGLAKQNVSLDEIRHVFLTHIHLDHAGATGEFTKRGARAYVHPRGAPHLVDPTQLMSSAQRVFGGWLESYLGGLSPSPAESIRAVEDGETISIGGVSFQAIETPGHARHHHAWLLEIDRTRHLFTGDIAGMRLPGTEFAVLPMVPPEFDPSAWLDSIQRIRALHADAIWITHFGLLEEQDAFLDQVVERLSAECAFVTGLIEHEPEMSPEARRAAYRAWQLEQGRPYGLSEATLDATCDEVHYNGNLAGVTRFLEKGPPC